MKNRRDGMVEEIMMRTDMTIKDLPYWLFRFDEKKENKL